MQRLRHVTHCKTNIQLVAWVVILSLALSITVASVMRPAGTGVPCLIRDNGRLLACLRDSEDPQTILDKAGIRLNGEDYFTAYQNRSGELEIQVVRVSWVDVSCDGELRHLRSENETVGQLLNRTGIVLGEKDRLSCDPDARITNGMSIDVIRVTEKTEEYDHPLAYETVYYEDPNLAPGETRVFAPGKEGLAHSVATVTYANGVETGRTIQKQTVLKEPEAEISLRGADGETQDLLPTENYTKVLSCLGTAYSCDGRAGITATGTVVHIGTIAVDPKVIPLGSKLYIVSDDGQYLYGYGTAEDTGGLIKGNRVDLYMDTTAECFQFGARRVTVYVLD